MTRPEKEYNPIPVARDFVISQLRKEVLDPHLLHEAFEAYEAILFDSGLPREKACSQMIEFTSSLVTRFTLGDVGGSLDYFVEARNKYKKELGAL